MKKLNKIIVLLIIMSPFMAKADMGAPMSSYSVRIINPDGVVVKNYNETEKRIAYDTICKVSYEYNEHVYAKCGEDTTEYEILLSDVSPLEVTLDDYKQDIAEKYYVLGENVYLYAGPSKVYGKVTPETLLAVGTTIQSEYYDEQWIYIDYKGAKGWVYKDTMRHPNDDIGVVNLSDISIKTLEKTKMYKDPTMKEELGKTIPKNVELKTLYSYFRGYRYYVEYDGVKGWVAIESGIFDKYDTIRNIAYKHATTLTVKNTLGVDMYENLEDENSKIMTIPYGEELISNYYLQGIHEWDWYEIEYDGKIGYISGGDIESKDREEENIIEDQQEETIGTIEETVEEKNSIPMKTFLIYVISGVVILSATAVVTIILINKKKKVKKNNA